MTTAKKSAALASHPWELQLAACRDIPLSLCVFDATAAIAYLQRSPAAKQLANIHLVQEIFDIAEHASAVCSGLEIADATPYLQTLLSARSANDLHLKFAGLMQEAPLRQLMTLTQALVNSEMPRTSFQLTSETPKIGVTAEFLERRSHQNRSLILAKFELATTTIDQLSQLARFDSLLDGMSEFVVIVGLNGDISFRNRSAKTMLGQPATQMSFTVKDFFAPESEAAIGRGCQEIISGLSTWCGTLTLNDKHNTKLQCHMSAVQQSKQGEIIGFAIVGRCAISEETLRFEVEIRDQLIENSGQLVIQGQIFGQVIHEINNPLTVILGKAERIIALAEKNTADLVEYTLAGEKIIKMSRRVEKIMRSMRLFSHRNRANPIGKTPVCQIVSDVRDLIDSSARKCGVDVKIPEIPRELLVHADSLKLSQILVNLFNNSYDAVESQPQPWVELQVTSDAHWITLKVIDSGKGIPKDIAPKLFDAFFSTKSVRTGTGIGLTLSRQIARRFGGDLYLDESAAHTAFALILPRLAADDPGSKEEIGTIVV